MSNLKSKYKVKTSDILASINEAYKVTNTISSGLASLEEVTTKLGLEVLGLYESSKKPCKLRCTKCSTEFTTTLESLRLSKYGCSSCANNKPKTQSEIL